jgi:hypothetical protein
MNLIRECGVRQKQNKTKGIKMQPHQQRVVEEKNELFEKITKLQGFLLSQMFQKLSTNEQNLLKMQYATMVQYSEILGMRIETFNDGVV